jgi:hypothetical protein
MLVVHHYDRVGVLSAVFSQLKHAGINLQETENIVFEGAAPPSPASTWTTPRRGRSWTPCGEIQRTSST